jgi:aspartate aminotransferase
MPVADLQHVAQAARRHDCWVISDEIYSSLVYDGQMVGSIAALPGMIDRTVIVDRFSKTYAMTGWRLGYGMMPVGLAKRIDLLLTHSVGRTAHFTQIAGLEALAGPQEPVADMVGEYQSRRDLIVDGLNRIPGITCRRPQGAFYVFPSIKAFGRNSTDVTDMLLEEAGVAVLPGSSFGLYGEGYLRLSYATSTASITDGLKRMTDAFRKMGPTQR